MHDLVINQVGESEMKVANHLLVADGSAFTVTADSTPNMGGALKTRFLVIHYTAGVGASGAVNWLKNPEAKASAHLVIARDTGNVTQLVPFNRIAWHAGVSSWQGLEGMNAFSIGIELDNAGRLTREGGKWVNWAKRVIPDTNVVEAQHKNDNVTAGWHTYSAKQMESLIEVAAALHAAYGFQDVIGHDDIAPKRKSDPGPAFPMESFRARILGRS